MSSSASVHVRVTILRSTLEKREDRGHARLLRGGALLLVGVATLLRIAYLLYACPYDLAPDEAHYWEWSRHWDWSYYSKGPLVAWLIRGSCELFGNTMPAVRLPAVLCGSLTLLGLYVLTLRVYRSDKLALGVVALGMFFPALAVGSLLMTIDAPFVCCWTWALVLAHKIILSPRSPLSPRPLMAMGGLGLLIGLGILAKYTMALFPVLLVLFLLSSSRHRGVLLTRGFYLMALTAALCCLPIVIWNAQHEWVTFFHVGRQAGLQKEAGFDWRQPAEFLAGQVGLLLGFWFVAWVGAVTGRRTLNDESRRLLWWLSAPVFLGFLALSFHTQVEPNWPAPAYLSGMVLAAGWVVRQVTSSFMAWRRLVQASTACAVVLGVVLTVFLHRTDWLYPLLPAELQVRRVDPTCRLRGWQKLAAEVDRLRAELRAAGEEPVLVATSWALPGEVAFYLDDHPEVHNIALAVGGRHSQYDFWRPNPIADPEPFRGRTLICLGPLPEPAKLAFERVDPPFEVTQAVGDRVLARWQLVVAHGFQGFGNIRGRGY
jgi:4-amino-4-deoxy-L-arabinose transferase-like glycosyltransferase